MENEFEYPENFIKYLGTSGGRFSMITQQRSTGGIWFRYGGVQGVIDPGPGSLVHICESVPKLSAEDIDVIILTHKHIDHSTDANVLIECMTHGGFETHGCLVAPDDALNGDEAVVIKFSQKRVPRIVVPKNAKIFHIGDVSVEPVTHQHHGVDCFGYIFRCEGLKKWGIISDGRMLPEFPARYAGCNFLSLNVTFANIKKRLDHISVEEARELFTKLHPKTAVLTHLGSMLTAPDGGQYLQDLDTPTTHVIPATDGMVVNLDSNEIYEITENGEKIISYRKLQ